MTDQPQPQPLDLDAIEARATVASPAPWSTHSDWPGRVFSRNQFSGHIARATGTWAERNAAFVAHARTDVPALVSEARRLRAELDAVRSWVVNTIHGTAAAEVGSIVGQQPPPIEYCGHCKRTHLDCQC